MLLYLMIAVAGWRVWRARGFAGTRVALVGYAVVAFASILNLALWRLN
jgi:tryptophan-rich sensory protein